ncbi:hypothetical protein OCF64_29480 [Bacillus wiedmannii]|uniref:hypothetical protein n=1 Tax=Bacillus wiedmannii TaxID=1890302 RepID=UPI0021CF4DCB|nr:hypothetical protein [Bacillus wiedmannii]MCU5685828.1 hypothetical protein [Bacillus wiedmannii]
MSEKRKDGKMQKTTVKRDIIVETVGELNVEEFARQMILMVLGADRLKDIDESKAPKTKSPNNKE